MSRVTSRTLDGAVALVTGARGGIGRALCAALTDAGARVVASDIGDPPQDLPSDAWMSLDVTSADDWERAIGEIQTRFARLDCLINSAGICPVERIAETSLAQWRQVMSVNAESVLLSLKCALPLLRESGADRSGGASVVNIASAAGLRGVAFHGAYCASKAAVTLLTKAAAKECAALKYPVRVNSIHPSGVETHMTDSILARYVEVGLSPSIEAAKAAAMSGHPLGRMARPEEIAGGAVFLCSPAASYMTGAEIVIDGGLIC